MQADYIRGEGGQLLAGETPAWQYTDQNGNVPTDAHYGGLRHYHLDHLGSVRLVTDADKRTLGEHDYYPYGVTPTKAYQEELGPAPHIDPMRYTGHQRDFLGYLNVENTDYLDYMHARYYDPKLGRFLSIDPIRGKPYSPQSWNRYSYALNNPINITDPTGRYPCRYKLIGTDAEMVGVVSGTVVDGTCVDAEADESASDSMMAWVEGHEDVLGTMGNAATGFADNVTLSATKHLREYMGDDQAVDRCSEAYISGEISGMVWWTAFGGAIGGRIGGGNLAARELGQITLTDYAARGYGALSNIQKLEALGGAGGATIQTIKNVFSARWWGAVARTTMATGPTPAAAGGLAGLAVGGGTAVTSITNNCL